MKRSVLPLLMAMLFLLMGCGEAPPEPDALPPATVTQTAFAPEADATKTPVIFSDFPGIFILALGEGAYTHLFAYSPLDQPLTRLTSGEWDDIHPTLSPDGSKIAFASNRSGYWDLYLLDIKSGETTRLTNSPYYEGAPSWSPDGAWLAVESYRNNNLDILAIPISDSSQDPIWVTSNPAADHSPAWSPTERELAFVSTRGGDSDIYLADLDNAVDSQFVDLSKTPYGVESHPIWSPDGTQLIWASNRYDDQPSGIYRWQRETPDILAVWIGQGDWAVWNAAGDSLLTMLEGDTAQYLSAYTVQGKLLLQPFPLSGSLQGMVWLPSPLPDSLPQPYLDATAYTPTPLWAESTATPVALSVREKLVMLEDLQAPYPQFHDDVDDSFMALREAVAERSGWDALANLENAFIPLTTALSPGMQEDWLYTGRAFALNPVIANAGWMVTTRHEIGNQTYWRIYLYAQEQNDSKGMPLHEPLWDLTTRYSLDPASYEAGGTFAPVPAGYWVDFTALARNYGWQRLPASSNWRHFYKGTRFTTFVQKGNLSWYEAMLELYPPDILLTPTPLLPPSKTPSPTPRPTRTPQPTRTPVTPTLTNTPLSLFQITTPTP